MLVAKLKDYIVTNFVRELLVLAMLSAVSLSAASLPAHAQQPASDQKRLAIVASFSILGDFARQVGGDRVSVTSIVGPNSDSHTYRATPQDVKSLGLAALIITNGLGFDPFMDRAIKAMVRKPPVVIASRAITPLRSTPEQPQGQRQAHGHGHAHSHKPGIDPHAWQSIPAARAYILAIRDGLIAVDEQGKAVYEANAQRYLQELSAVEAEIAALFAGIAGDKRVIVTSHDSFGYLARDLGLKIEAIQGLSTESEPNARDVSRIVRLVKQHKARAVFLEAQSSPRLATQIASESGAKLGGTLFSDSLSDDKGLAPTYIAMIRHNAKAIAAALAE